jgi:transposase
VRFCFHSIHSETYHDAIFSQAAQAVSNSREALASVFERIENFFRRLETYVEVPPTAGMTDIIVKIMVEVLCILSIATKELKQSRASELIHDGVN